MFHLWYCLPQAQRERQNKRRRDVWTTSDWAVRTKHFDVNFITETSSLRQLQRKTLSSAASASSWAVMAAWHERWTRCFGLLSVCSFTLRSSIRRDSKPTSKYDTHTSLAKRTFVKESTESKQAKERAQLGCSQQQAPTTTTTTSQHTNAAILAAVSYLLWFPFCACFSRVLNLPYNFSEPLLLLLFLLLDHCAPWTSVLLLLLFLPLLATWF